MSAGDVLWTESYSDGVRGGFAVRDEQVVFCLVDNATYDITVQAHGVKYGTSKWSDTNIGGKGRVAPHYPNDSDVYVTTTDPGLIKYDASTGNREWTADLNTSLTASPATNYGQVYVADDSGGMYAVDPSDGSEIWSHQSDTNEAIYAGPNPVGGSVYFAQTGSGAIYSLDPQTGNRNWKYSGQGYPMAVTEFDGNIHATDDDVLAAAHSPDDGSTVWTNSLGINNSELGGGPTGGGGRIYHQCGSNGVYALDPADGSELWSRDFYVQGMTYAEETLYIGTFNSHEIIALDASDGSTLWTVGFNDIVYADPVVEYNTLFASDRDGNIKAIDTGTVRSSNGSKALQGASSHNESFEPVDSLPGERDGLVFIRGDKLKIGTAGETDYVFRSGTSVPNSGNKTFAYESGSSFAVETDDEVSPLGRVESFEDGDINEYDGRRGDFDVYTNIYWPIDGDHYLYGEADGSDNNNIVSTTGLNQYPRRGNTFYCNVAYDNEQVGFNWAEQGSRGDDAYGVTINMEDSEMRLGVGGDADPPANNLLDSTTFYANNYTEEYLIWEVEWGDPTITVNLYETDSNGDPKGTPLATVSAADTTYDSGGIGFLVDSVGGGDVYGVFDYVRGTDV